MNASSNLVVVVVSSSFEFSQKLSKNKQTLEQILNKAEQAQAESKNQLQSVQKSNQELLAKLNESGEYQTKHRERRDDEEKSETNPKQIKKKKILQKGFFLSDWRRISDF